MIAETIQGSGLGMKSSIRNVCNVMVDNLRGVKDWSLSGTVSVRLCQLQIQFGCSIYCRTFARLDRPFALIVVTRLSFFPSSSFPMSSNDSSAFFGNSSLNSRCE